LKALAQAQQLTLDLLPAVLKAARAEMHYFKAGVQVTAKSDDSPVTAADHEAEAIVLECLARVAPDVPVVAEERAAAGQLPSPKGRFFLVDALDGTRYFIRGKPEFSVNVALIEDTAPVYGLIYVPPTGRLYFTGGDGYAYSAVVPCESDAPAGIDPMHLKRIVTRAPDRSNLMAYTSRNSAGASGEFLRALQVHESRSLGSSEKFCLIASG